MAENGIAAYPENGGIGGGAYPVCDGSWNLRILVTDLQVERTLRVKGELHVGGVMLKLVDELGRTLLLQRIKCLTFSIEFCARQ